MGCLSKRSAQVLGLASVLFSTNASAGQTASQDIQKEVITACLVLEAGVEGNPGMQGVMNVIDNRASGNPNDFYSVVTRSRQFSSLNGVSGGAPENYWPVIAYARSSRRWTDAEMIVERAFARNLPDLTGGATYYYSLGIKSPPKWAQSLQETVRIKHQRFMREPRV